jgi:long-chain acyl-CoA synthetase
VLVSHPAVLEAAVVGVKDSTGDEAIHAFVVLEEGAAVKQKELLAICREKLASYKIPRTVAIRDELPKNALGKVLKRELREIAAKSS